MKTNQFLPLLVFIPMLFSNGCINSRVTIENFNGTIQIEELSKPPDVLIERNTDSLNSWFPDYRRDLPTNKQTQQNTDSIRNKYLIDGQDIGVYTEPYELNIIAKSNMPKKLVNYTYNSFSAGMYEAYIHHRPIVLTPDIVWLLICQGFANHVNNNSEKLRHYFVDFQDKRTLIVEDKEGLISLDNPQSPWQDVFPQFTTQIALYTGSDLINTLTSNFTTTTSDIRVASQITIMYSFKSYFNYGLVAGCGIPYVILKGTTKDWQSVLAKAQYLKKYELEWWIDDVEPILEEFIRASQGSINKRFWMNMYKLHKESGYGNPEVINGWIVKFFPYTSHGDKNNLSELRANTDLPNEIVKVDLAYKDLLTGDNTIPLELWAGIFGWKQDSQTYLMEPIIGWLINRKPK